MNAGSRERWRAVVIITSNSVVTVVSLAGSISVSRDNVSATIITRSSAEAPNLLFKLKTPNYK
jgi:tartrate dehydratase beta subunit/fumarate hydratase class I family protein